MEVRAKMTAGTNQSPDLVVASTPTLTEQTWEDKQTSSEIPVIVSRPPSKQLHVSDEWMTVQLVKWAEYSLEDSQRSHSVKRYRMQSVCHH